MKWFNGFFLSLLLVFQSVVAQLEHKTALHDFKPELSVKNKERPHTLDRVRYYEDPSKLPGFSATTGAGYALGLTQELSGGTAFDIGVCFLIQKAKPLHPYQIELTTRYDAYEVDVGDFRSLLVGFRIRY